MSTVHVKNGKKSANYCIGGIFIKRLNTKTIFATLKIEFKACMAGIVFAKFTKPTHRGETIMFSRNALISRRNGDLYLMVRLAHLT